MASLAANPVPLSRWRQFSYFGSRLQSAAPHPDHHAIVLGETNSGKPSQGDFEKMARRRFQDPKPSRLGKWWYLLCWQDEFIGGRRLRKRKRIKLAPASMPEREVRKIAAEILRPMN